MGNEMMKLGKIFNQEVERWVVLVMFCGLYLAVQ